MATAIIFRTRNIKEWDALAELVKADPKKYWDAVSTKKELDMLDSLLRDSGWSIRMPSPKLLASGHYAKANIPLKAIYGQHYILEEE